MRQQRCHAADGDIRVGKCDAAIADAVRMILYEGIERCRRRSAIDTAVEIVSTPLDVEVAGRGRLVAVAIGIQNEIVARLVVVITERPRAGQSILINCNGRYQADIVDERTERVLLPGSLEGEHVVRPGAVHRYNDLLPDAGGHARATVAWSQPSRPRRAARSRPRARRDVARLADPRWTVFEASKLGIGTSRTRLWMWRGPNRPVVMNARMRSAASSLFSAVAR